MLVYDSTAKVFNKGYFLKYLPSKTYFELNKGQSAYTNFTGRIEVYNLNGILLRTDSIENSKRVSAFSIDLKRADGAEELDTVNIYLPNIIVKCPVCDYEVYNKHQHVFYKTCPNCGHCISDCPSGGGGGVIPPSGGGVDVWSSPSPTAENPGSDYKVENFADSISLKQKLECFKNIPDNINTTYTAKLYADLPINGNPKALFNLSTQAPGHAFITLNKTNGSRSVTQTFGFYPQKGYKSILGTPVASQINDDGEIDKQHEYNASIFANVSLSDFNAMIDLANRWSSLKYNLSDFNCTDYAIGVFNQGIPLNQKIVVPDWIVGDFIFSSNFGTTPNGLYKNK